MNQIIQASDFAELLNDSFDLSGAGINGKIQAKLIEVKELNLAPAPGTERKPFSLQFRLAPDQKLSQNTCDLTHPSLSLEMILLVPIGEDQDGWYLEACFS